MYFIIVKCFDIFTWVIGSRTTTKETARLTTSTTVRRRGTARNALQAARKRQTPASTPSPKLTSCLGFLVVLVMACLCVMTTPVGGNEPTYLAADIVGQGCYIGPAGNRGQSGSQVVTLPLSHYSDYIYTRWSQHNDFSFVGFFTGALYKDVCDHDVLLSYVSYMSKSILYILLL